MKQFILKSLAIVSAIATVLLLDGVIAETLSFAAVLALPAAAFITWCLLRASLYKRRPTRSRRAAAARRVHSMPLQPAQPALRVATGAPGPNGPRAA